MRPGIYRALMIGDRVRVAKEPWQAVAATVPMVDVCCWAFLVLWKAGQLDTELGES